MRYYGAAGAALCREKAAVKMHSRPNKKENEKEEVRVWDMEFYYPAV